MSAEAVQFSRPRRPLGVWVMTVFDSLVAGVSLLTAVFKGWEYVPDGFIVLWTILGLGICISAHVAWYGNRKGRNMLLILMTVYLGLMLVGNVRYIGWALGGDLDEEWYLGQVYLALGAIVWLVANYWLLLLGRRAKAFYS